MDFGGLSWAMITIVGALVLAVVLLWGVMRNKASPGHAEDTEEATRRLYAEEEREHHGESDNVP
jgi:hypothetical protein